MRFVPTRPPPPTPLYPSPFPLTHHFSYGCAQLRLLIFDPEPWCPTCLLPYVFPPDVDFSVCAVVPPHHASVLSPSLETHLPSQILRFFIELFFFPFNFFQVRLAVAPRPPLWPPNLPTHLSKTVVGVVPFFRSNGLNAVRIHQNFPFSSVPLPSVSGPFLDSSRRDRSPPPNFQPI